jgi:hypothetical protein
MSMYASSRALEKHRKGAVECITFSWAFTCKSFTARYQGYVSRFKRRRGGKMWAQDKEFHASEKGIDMQIICSAISGVCFSLQAEARSKNVGARQGIS